MNCLTVSDFVFFTYFFFWNLKISGQLIQGAHCIYYYLADTSLRERIRVTFVKEVCSEEWENCFPRFLSQHLFQFHCCELGPVSIPNQWSLARRVELCCWMLTWAFRALGEVGFPQIRVISKGWKPVSTAGWIYILFIVDLHVLAQYVVLWSVEVSMNIWLF